MRQAKFTMNALLLVVLIFSALEFFFTLYLADKADRSAVNDYYRIEGTDLGIRYSNKKDCGIYEGPKNTGTLRLSGTFGHDWGIVKEGDSLFLNEYLTSDLGLTICNLVKVDISTFGKEVLLKDTVLRGRCTSGELVCMNSCFLPSVFPETNELCKLYSMTNPEMDPESGEYKVLILDPVTGEVLYETTESNVSEESFEDRYLTRNLEEIRNEI